MTNNLSNSLAGLSLLTGTSTASFGLSSVESRAVRLARAQFTVAPVTPPWSQKQSPLPQSNQVSAIRGMASIIEQVRASGPVLPPDIQTSFTTYKALDRLRILAESAMKASTSAAERTLLQNTFAKGMSDLQAFLAGAPTDKLTYAFKQVSRRAETIAVPKTPSANVAGAVVGLERADAISGLTGNEKLTITLTKSTGTDVVTVDLATTPQPPTLDSIANAFNAAIAAVPMRNPDGSLALTAEGQEQPKWQSRFEPTKGATGWGLSLVTAGTEQVALDDLGGRDALMVASGTTVLDAPTATRVMRLTDSGGTLNRDLLATISAVDRLATEVAAMKPAPAPNAALKPAEVFAATVTNAMTTDSLGFTYIVGTTAGDLGNNRSDGQNDLFLSKLDTDGKVVWQRTLGTAGAAQGSAVTIAPNGDVVVAGTVTGDVDGANSDGDMLVARFDALGNEKFASLVRAVGAESASAVAVGLDGSIFVGGRAESGTGDAFLARLDSNGRVQERRTIDSGSSDAVRALQVDRDGSLLALTSEGGVATLRRLSSTSIAQDLGSIQLGNADARALTVGEDGAIGIGGATSEALIGAQANSLQGSRDGFVAVVTSSLASVRTTYLGSGANDQVDSVAFVGSAIFAGGRTSGDMFATRSGTTDGFVASLDVANGAVNAVTQFGRAATQTEPVYVATLKRGDNALSALGFSRGPINAEVSGSLVTQTSLRAGDEFSIRVNGGRPTKVVILADDTLSSLSTRIRQITRLNGVVAVASTEAGGVLRIDAKPGNSIDLVPGRTGFDALAKLGLTAGRLAARPILDADAPRVRPGGSFGLDLSLGLNVSTRADAGLALGRLKDALSMTQTAFRSLYWDKSKEALVNGVRRGQASPYEAAQVGRYQEALSRLTSAPSATGF